MKIPAFVLLTAFAPLSAFADNIYTWKDESGHIHFGDSAQSPKKAKQVSAPPAVKSAFTADQLVGNWSIEGARNGVPVRTLFTMAADGTFSGSAEANGNPVMTYSGKWELVGDRINWLYTNASVPLPADAKRDADKIISVSPSKIEALSLASGEKRTFVRH